MNEESMHGWVPTFPITLWARPPPRSSSPGDVSLSLRVPLDLLGCVLENKTTRPPWSPVAKYSPLRSNSTAVKVSASLAVVSAPNDCASMSTLEGQRLVQCKDQTRR